jgi:hypothetical protein
LSGNNAAPTLRLVPKKAVEQRPCENTIEALVYLLQEASAGRLKGLAYAGILADEQFIIETTGAAHVRPLFTLGAIDILAGDLRDKVRDRNSLE